MRYPRVLIITSCTGEKRFKPENQLTQEDFKHAARLRKREKQLAEFMAPAAEMYTGMQHIQLMEGVQNLRKTLEQPAIDVVIISAGYGLIPEERLIAPYEVTFNAMKGHEIDSWAKQLKIHHSVEEIIPDYDLIFVLLGEQYLRAIALPVTLYEEQTWIFLAPRSNFNFIQESDPQAFILPLSNAEAKQYRFGSVGLKGFLFKQFASVVAKRPELFEQIHQNPSHFRDVIDQTTQLELNLDLPIPAAKSKSKQDVKKIGRDEFIPIPDLPPAPNIHLGVQYFIPEWDDRVDPRYNFLKDTFGSPDRDPYADDVYAHELFLSPNYDGVLISKVVVDESQTRRAKVEAQGVHKFIRFPGKIMGDCGAFGYIEEDEPPYNTDEILDYYHQLGFNYGVSIDHLIVGPFAEPGIREKRYDLTCKNAEEFLKKYQQRDFQFTPIGVAQGWSPESYAKAVKELIEMGYDYIALGGLARAQNREILPILEAIHPHLISTVRMHLFGVARTNAISAFRHLGVTSCDSASPLRQAWLGATANYYTPSDKRYAAIRVPPVDNKSGLRIKRLLEAGVADLKTLQQLEKDALRSLREFDVGKLDLESTLQAVLAYDELLELPKDGMADPEAQAKRRAKHEVLYREVLEAQPWKSCDCPICQEIGIEVLIFRNNNRNRRRGFHNTYVFYKRFRELLNKFNKVRETGMP
jgi:Queuine tRNA-ribosyltransferase